MKHPDYYQFLGIPRQATIEQINKAFRAKAMELHPDKNKDNPQAKQDFVLLTQAYQTLTDAGRRARYDASLPPEQAAPRLITDPLELWRETAEVFFKQADRYTPAIDALRLSTPFAIEGNLLIVGIDPVKSNLIGYLGAPETQNHIRRILAELSGRTLDFRMIAGTSAEEWAVQKSAEERIKQRRNGDDRPQPEQPVVQKPAAKKPVAPVTTEIDVDAEPWDELLQSVTHQWAHLENRSRPQVRARFIVEQLALLAAREQQSRADSMPEETIQRSLARTLERIATVTGIDSSIIALEYLRT